MNCNNCDTATKQPVSSVNFVTILPFFTNFGCKVTNLFCSLQVL